MTRHSNHSVLVGFVALVLSLSACAPDGTGQIDSQFEYDDIGESSAALTSTIQAEDFSAASGCKVATNQAGYLGAGFADFGGSGTWIEWDDVQVGAAGQRTLRFRYANAGAAPRESAIFVNGSKVSDLAFASTGSWVQWGTVEIVANLSAGANTVRVQAKTDAGGPNLDSMEVSDSLTETQGISVVGTRSVYDFDAQGLTISRPSGVQSGDLLVLVLHRTDDFLPLKVDGWTRGGECYKRDNGYQCATAADCTSWSGNGKFCNHFGSAYKAGQDLAQAVFYKTASNEPPSYRFDLNQDSSGHPGWAILTALRGAASTNPVRAWSVRGCDNTEDSLFPTVYGQSGDFLLLSQSFDDNVGQSTFGPPPGTSLLGFINGDHGPAPDETGYLFGQRITSTGQTGEMRTSGVGGPSCKDALLAMTIRPR